MSQVYRYSPDSFLEVGSILYHAHERVMSLTLPKPYSLVVGKPILSNVSTSEMDRARIQMLGWMLYSFAVENWLKGLALKKGGSEQIGDKLRGDWQDEMLAIQLGESYDPQEIFRVLNKALLAKEDLRTDIAEEDGRYVEQHSKNIKKLSRQHNIQELLENAGIDLSKSKQEDLTNFLKMLEYANQAGRYPYSNSELKGQVISSEGIAHLTTDHRDYLNGLIFHLYEELNDNNEV